MNLKKLSIVVSLAFVIVVNAQNPAVSQLLPYQDANQALEVRLADALSRMTVEEKIAIIHAQSTFSSPGVQRLGIPELWTTDGPHGIRPDVVWDEWDQAGFTNDSCTAFPALTCLAATWNPDMALQYGKAIGEEARYREKDVLLGPGVNIYRTPLNGRNFEYMGEDPYLASVMVVPYIKGVQQNGVAACVKHFALNNQEYRRNTTDVRLSDRALYEIYLPAFKAAVQDGGAWTIMSSYNLYNGQHVSQNKRLLKEILRDQWGFDGAVLSDWGAIHDTKQAIDGGVDIEFGTWVDRATFSNNKHDNYFLAYPYLKMISEGQIDTTELDIKASNALRLIFRTAMNPSKPFGSLNSPEHVAAARMIAGEGIVLLKNSGSLLPLNLEDKKKIVVVGENAIKKMTVGGGSSSLKARREVTVLEALKDRVGNDVEIIFARGYVGDPKATQNGVAIQDISDERSEAELIAEAVAAAKDADYVVFVGGLNKAERQDCEGYDRKELGLPYGQDRLIDELAKVNSNIVFVNISGNAVAMPWVTKVPAIIQAWYGGSEAGNAIVDVLSGDINPSGKLPFTFPVKLEDVGSHALGEYPGNRKQIEASTQWGDTIQEYYHEDIYVGYRWTDKQKVTPLFPFGHGLSYTSFEYGKPTADKKKIGANDTVTVTVNVKNTGNREGEEVVQLYIADKKSSLPRPVKELKGFKKVKLAPGEETVVNFTIEKNSLSYYDDHRQEWIAEPGLFEAIIASSSQDLKGSVYFELK